jgi:ornithine carbamoyltransferase
MPRHFVDLFELSPIEARALLDQAEAFKKENRRQPLLAGRTLGLLFEKPSLRTRVSFEAAMIHLGGATIFLTGAEAGLGGRESLEDIARVLSGYLDAIAVRAYSHQTVESLARLATVPVINALCDIAHPCQAMGDALTIREALGGTDGVQLTFVGDGNNVARSLAVASALLGMSFTLACPPKYAFPPDFLERMERAFPDRVPRIEHDPRAAVAGADVVYTDVWTSMGQEAEQSRRKSEFARYQVDGALMSRARRGAIFMHCLPAHRGEEVTHDVIESPASRVFPQAENRLHFQKALLVWLIEEQSGMGRSLPSRNPSRRRLRRPG